MSLTHRPGQEIFSPRVQVLVEDVKEHALAHYEEGWDVIVEAFDDADIADLVGLARTSKGAIAKVAEYVGIRESYAAEIRATAF
jgi:hypothetical protein